MKQHTTTSDERLLPEDLSSLERRGQLTAVQQRRLQMALSASRSLQWSHQLGHDFDALDTDCAADEALIAAVVAAGRARFAGLPVTRHRSTKQHLLPWLLVAATMAISAAAGATLWPYARTFITSKFSEQGTANAAKTPPQQRALKAKLEMRHANTDTPTVEEREPVMVERTTLAPTVMSAAASSRPADRMPRATPTPDRPDSVPELATPLSANGSFDLIQHTSTPTEQSAAQLFSDANRARRGDNLSRARSLYQRLRHTYPEANETALSYVIVGRIDLRSNAYAEALGQFDQYLRRAPSGPLAEEALEGKAAACRQLGQFEQEAVTWRELLSRFPSSVYAKSARERLDALQ